MTRVRGGLRPQSRTRRSDAWQPPKPNENVAASVNGAAAAELFAGENPPPDPAVIGQVDPQVHVDQAMPIEAAPPFSGEIPIGLLSPDVRWPMAPDPDLFASSFGAARVTSKPASLQLAKVTPIEVDRLWDWVRVDREGVMNFLGFIPDHSLHLYKWIDNFQALEREGRARFHSIYVAGSLIGFLMLHPIQAGADAVADCHLYLSQEARGNVRSLLPQLVAELDRIVPYMALRVVTARDDEWARLLRGVGFAAQIVLTRPAAALTGNDSGT